jgi:hypothetical protein
VGRSVEAWKGELIDLSGCNTRLHYKDLKQGTLSLSAESGVDEVAVDDLLSGRTVRPSEMYSVTNRAAAARRAHTVKAKTSENMEERGIETLFLALGHGHLDRCEQGLYSGGSGFAAPDFPVGPWRGA